MSQAISASVSLVIETSLEPSVFQFKKKNILFRQKCQFFSGSRSFWPVWCVGSSLPHSFRHFLLDKGGFFYLRWGVHEALRKHVQGEEAMENKVRRTPGNNTGPLNGAATGEEYGA
jgi:hypothetical protein